MRKRTTPCCPKCDSVLVITPDAIGRPRYRCPQCQGIAPPSANTGIDLPLHNQTAMSSADLEWPGPVDPSAAPQQLARNAQLRRVARALGRALRDAPIQERAE